ncbi:hypothetical protein SKAU_G00112220 [Synaphobranchus kaupii]|uniref:Uncharacterized protein n=1 Tax=Synaphobranchus kaupii TaxID=118154 RepID=A0A9Q1J872_SYNKA|nr:hypothetical protein SKAU_G00112220 [Synaphobranchus kaupii]
MISNITIYCISSLLFLNLVAGKPVSSLQSLKELLEEESNAPYLDSEEREAQGKELNTENVAFNKEASLHSWEPNSRDSALSSKDHALMRLLNDILSSSKRLLNGMMELDECARTSPYLNSSDRTYLFN